MSKVEPALALSLRGRSILSTSVAELLTQLSSELVNSRTTLKDGVYSVSLGKLWVSTGADRTEITATLSFRIEPPVSAAKQRAVARAFS
jgi:hypothetical protein